MIPGDTLIATDISKSFEAATDGVVDNMKRQLSKHKERIQDKSHHTKASS
jgi:ribosome-associated translation inhibitor RaiA